LVTFLATFFLATFFLLVFLLLDLLDLLVEVFLREVETFFRFLLEAFFAAIGYSCRIEKRAGLYIACASMEAYFFREFTAIGQDAESPAEWGLRADCHFRGSIVLLAEFLYTNGV
jgi:hypothetical protein